MGRVLDKEEENDELVVKSLVDDELMKLLLEVADAELVRLLLKVVDEVSEGLESLVEDWEGVSDDIEVPVKLERLEGELLIVVCEVSEELEPLKDDD